jgi:hypothetical protein
MPLSSIFSNPRYADYVATGLKVFGTLAGGQAEAQASEFNEQVAKNNAVLARRFAKQSRERGAEEAIRTAEGTKQEIAGVRASAAARGVRVDTGSNVARQGDIARAGKHDELTQRMNAARQAAGFEQQALDAQARAALLDSQAKDSRFGSLLSAGGQVASKWYEWNK